MGRWRRRHNNGTPIENGRRRGRGKVHNQPPFAKEEHSRIRSYLDQYRMRAERVCFQTKVDGRDNADVVERNKEDSYASPTTIAKHLFPALTEGVLSAPYLDLPSSLSAKQRWVVHELCVDVGLFHCSAGDRNVHNDRRIVVSIHYDGLNHVSDLSEPIRVPVMRCLPWYYRNDNENLTPSSDGKSERLTNSNNKLVLESTLKGRQAIEALVDQPGRCLRDAHDFIDFTELETMDLTRDNIPSNIESEQGAWMLVDTPEKMAACVKEITDSRTSEIGLDLECHNRSKYEQATCLVQLHANGKDYVVDTLAPGVWDSVRLLEPLFGDRNIVKIGHSVAGTDVPSLHRDFGLFLVNCFDTYEAAKALHLRKQSLVGLCEYYGLRTSADYSNLKKDYQNCDWRRRPLTEPMIRYGRHDAHFLVKLRKLMIRDLTRDELWEKFNMEEDAKAVAATLAATLSSPGRRENDDGSGDLPRQSLTLTLTDDSGYFTAGEEESDKSPQGTGGDLSCQIPKQHDRRSVFIAKDLRMHLGLMRVISLSQEACLKLWKAPREHALKNDAFVNVLKQAVYGFVIWNDSRTKLYQQLVRWRDRVAEVEGTYPGAVCSLDFLVSISKRMPSCHWSLRQIDYFLPPILADESLGYSQELLSIVSSSRNDCTFITDEESVSALSVRSYKERIVGGRGKSEGNDCGEASTCDKNVEPTSSLSNKSLKRAVALVLASTTLGMFAVFALRTMKSSKKR